MALLRESGFKIVFIVEFDPILPSWALVVFRPALAIYHAKRI